VTATITNHRGQVLTGDIKCWMGRSIVEIETPDGCRHIGRLRPDGETLAGTRRSSAMG
jgi:hypothetical protein